MSTEKEIRYVYIYNLEQAYYYIKHDVKPVFIDRHPTTNKTYFQFRKGDTRDIYQKWCDKNN